MINQLTSAAPMSDEGEGSFIRYLPDDKDSVVQKKNLSGTVQDLTILIETAWVILNCAGAWLGYLLLPMTAGISTAPKPDQ
jgi:hypothetical protein